MIKPGNALFGNLQVVAARQMQFNPVLYAAANSSGGVMGKMISPQNITTGVSVVGMAGQEGAVFARTFKHSFILTALISAPIIAQQYVLGWMIPALARRARLTLGSHNSALIRLPHPRLGFHKLRRAMGVAMGAIAQPPRTA